MYKIDISDEALKELGKFPKEARERIFSVLERISIRPGAHFKRLKGTQCFRLRAGDYRVIVELKGSDLKVVTVGHRKNVYKFL